MTPDSLLYSMLALLAVVAVLQIALILRPRLSQDDLTTALQTSLREAQQDLRREMKSGQSDMSDQLGRQMNQSTEAMERLVRGIGDQIIERLKEFGDGQTRLIAELKLGVTGQIDTLSNGLGTKFDSFKEGVSANLEATRSALTEAVAAQTSATTASFQAFEKRSTETLTQLGTNQQERLDAIAKATDALARRVNDSFQAFNLSQQQSIQALSESLTNLIGVMKSDLAETQKERLDTMAKSVGELAQQVDLKQKELQTLVGQRLDTLAQKNEEKLEQMRQTVDEKLQGTLEQRLGEQFTRVNEAFERMHTSLGEMRNIAKDVSGLQRTLTNVKSRGIVGEVHLENILEDLLSPDQWAKNVKVKEESQEIVEYALKIPNKGGDGHIWVVIDAKFPIEDYNRLLLAVEANDIEGADLASKQIETRVRLEARKINEKYINPPVTTEYGLLFLPNEGLVAEVNRRPGLVQKIQQECRVTIVGPAMLGAYLMTLRALYRDVAIEKRSTEVWQTLGAVSTEFEKFGKTFAAARKKVAQVDKAFEQIDTRTRAMERRLRTVTSLPEAEAANVLQLPTIDDDDESDDEE